MTHTITHSWDGTVLTITSDSGTSSADLKGDMGIRGPQGIPGLLRSADGTIDMSGYATEDYVDEKIASIDVNDVDLSGYYTKEQVDALIPSLEGYATKEEIPNVSKFVTEAQVLDLINIYMPSSGDEVSY